MATTEDVLRAIDKWLGMAEVPEKHVAEIREYVVEAAKRMATGDETGIEMLENVLAGLKSEILALIPAGKASLFDMLEGVIPTVIQALGVKLPLPRGLL